MMAPVPSFVFVRRAPSLRGPAGAKSAVKHDSRSDHPGGQNFSTPPTGILAPVSAPTMPYRPLACPTAGAGWPPKIN